MIGKQAAEYTSSEDSIFDDIRPCNDSEVKSELQKVADDKQLIEGILKFKFPILSRIFPKILYSIVHKRILNKCKSIKDISDFQNQVASFMSHMIETTTDGVSFVGFDKLDPKKGYLFISNHRDISLDPAFVDFALHKHGFDTVRIAIGDNLLKMPAATSLMRLNKSFIVKRSISSPRDKLKALTHLSAYIGLSLKEGHSIWIAQREGRAKDGDDKTDVAVLKMFHMYGRVLKQDFKEYIKSLNIVPVSISYEYDPADLAKANEIYEKQKHGVYNKGQFEDIKSIVNGIKGYKGRVNICAGNPIYDGFETPEQLAEIIDNFIWSHYKLYPSTLIAANADKDVSANDKAVFLKRIKAYPIHLRKRVLSMYAKAYENYLKTVK